jgi:hypothetical protein
VKIVTLIVTMSWVLAGCSCPFCAFWCRRGVRIRHHKMQRLCKLYCTNTIISSHVVTCDKFGCPTYSSNLKMLRDGLNISSGLSAAQWRSALLTPCPRQAHPRHCALNNYLHTSSTPAPHSHFNTRLGDLNAHNGILGMLHVFCCQCVTSFVVLP